MEDRILEVIKDPMLDMGLNIVRARFSGSAERKILEILLERTDGQNLSIEECANANRHIGAILDVEDIVQCKYNLEVSSAGVERPLVTLEDFDKFKGKLVALKLHKAYDGAKKFQGTLLGIDSEGNINFEIKGKLLEFSFSNIKDAKIVLTEELFRKLLKKPK